MSTTVGWMISLPGNTPQVTALVPCVFETESPTTKESKKKREKEKERKRKKKNKERKRKAKRKKKREKRKSEEKEKRKRRKKTREIVHTLYVDKVEGEVGVLGDYSEELLFVGGRSEKFEVSLLVYIASSTTPSELGVARRCGVDARLTVDGQETAAVEFHEFV